VSTRKTRLAAIRSLIGYASLHASKHAETISRVLATPPNGCDRAIVGYLSATEAAVVTRSSPRYPGTRTPTSPHPWGDAPLGRGKNAAAYRMSRRTCP
jgi:hypothetical protein